MTRPKVVRQASHWFVAGVLILGLQGPAQAQAAPAAGPCDVAVRAAERGRALEQGLMAAAADNAASMHRSAMNCLERVKQMLIGAIPGIPGISGALLEAALKALSEKACQVFLTTAERVVRPIEEAAKDVIGDVTEPIKGIGDKIGVPTLDGTMPVDRLIGPAPVPAPVPMPASVMSTKAGAGPRAAQAASARTPAQAPAPRASPDQGSWIDRVGCLFGGCGK